MSSVFNIWANFEFLCQDSSMYLKHELHCKENRKKFQTPLNLPILLTAILKSPGNEISLKLLNTNFF